MSVPTTINNLPAPVQQWLDKVLLSRPMPDLIHTRFAYQVMMPSKSGRIARFRRYNNLNTATVPLTDGVTPPPQTLTALNIDAQVDWYGTYTILTDQLTLTIQDPVLNENTSLLAQSMRETHDELTRDMLQASAAQVDCVNGSNGDLPTELTFQDIQSIFTALQLQSGKLISEYIEGEDRFATAPIRPAYWFMANTAIIPTLENVQGFINAANYPSNMTVITGEFGSVGNTRWTTSPLGSVSPNASGLGADVYNCFATAQQGYGVVNLEGAYPQVFYQPLGWGNDPLHQRCSLGFKYAGAYRILNDAWVNNLRSTLVA